MFLPSYLVALLAPLQWLDRRVLWLERYLETPLSEQDQRALQVACARSGCRFGKFYHWYLQKKVISKIWRTISREGVLRMTSSLDRSDYAALDEALASPNGLLLALPHHGLYINTIVSLVERVRQHRDIHIFYGDPATHPGNDVFDGLCRRIWLDDPQSGVSILYDNRQGLARALRSLQQGAAVIIMPDVFKDELETLQIPFCGRAMNIMMGTAVLARKTGATILPLVCRPQGKGMGFRTEIGPQIACCEPFEGEGVVETGLLNYRTMLKVFRFYESIMDKEIVYWQFSRQMYAHDVELARLDQAGMLGAATALVDDARLRVPSAFAFDGTVPAVTRGGV